MKFVTKKQEDEARRKIIKKMIFFVKTETREAPLKLYRFDELKGKAESILLSDDVIISMDEDDFWNRKPT